MCPAFSLPHRRKRRCCRIQRKLDEDSTHPKVGVRPSGRPTASLACPSTLLAQVRYLVPDIAIERFLKWNQTA